VCIDRNLITSQGPATAMPFAFAILEALTDAAVSKKIKGDMLVEG
jgi:putative intracellular protease/amidase